MAASLDAATITKDKVANYEAVFNGATSFTAKGGGHSGNAGDLAIDFTKAGGPLTVADISWFNATAAGDNVSVGFWGKKYENNDSSAFWFNSTSSNNGTRGYQAHVPWSNGHIYFDTVGCCNADQRIEAMVDATLVPDYADAEWWKDWHFFVFSKAGTVKQIWIDGALFLESTSDAAPLPTDFTSLVIGGIGLGNGLYHGVMDDFFVTGTALTEEQIKGIKNGGSPTALPATAKLVAYWDFNDFPPEGTTTTIPAADATAAAPNLIKITHRDGVQPWTSANVSLKVDGVDVTEVYDKTGDILTVTYVPSPLLPGQTKHTATLTYPDNAGNPTSMTWNFAVAPYSKDVVKGIIGGFGGAATFTSSGAGRSGAAGDYAFDGTTAGGFASVPDAKFLNEATTDNKLSVSVWIKKYNNADSSAFWIASPTQDRLFQAHVPWSNGHVYFDTGGGCCAAGQRIESMVDDTTLPSYTVDPPWWQAWHHFVFIKDGDVKQVWIDGTIFLDATGDSPMNSDIGTLFIGAGSGGGSRMRGQLDDFAVFKTGLGEADIKSLAAGRSPTELAASAGLLALWNFNDLPPQGLFSGVSPSEGNKTAAPNLVKISHQDGATAWDTAKTALFIDGAAVAAAVTKAGDLVTAKYVPSEPFAPKSTHTATLKYDGATVYEWSFTVGVYTKDLLHSYIGLLEGTAKYSDDKGGKTGAAGDYAIDMGKSNSRQAVHVLDASFLNEATKNDVFAVAGWQKLYQIANSAFFWAVSPTAGGGNRAIGTHAPWSNNNLYFDTAGCCSGGQRTTAAMTTDVFPNYSGNVSWWTDWHHMVFQKNANVKEIWIDGVLFTTGDNIDPLPSDITDAFFGFDPPDGASMLGLIDDVALFGTSLDEATIGKLVSGTKPNALGAAAKVLAYWDFNDASVAPPTPPTVSIGWNAGKLVITFEGTLQSANTVDGPYADVVGASPLAVDPTTAAFYRAVKK